MTSVSPLPSSSWSALTWPSPPSSPRSWTFRKVFTWRLRRNGIGSFHPWESTKLCPSGFPSSQCFQPFCYIYSFSWKQAFASNIIDPDLILWDFFVKGGGGKWNSFFYRISKVDPVRNNLILPINIWYIYEHCQTSVQRPPLGLQNSGHCRQVGTTGGRCLEAIPVIRYNSKWWSL